MSRLVKAKSKGSIFSPEPGEVFLDAPVPVGVLPLLADEEGALTLPLERQITALPFRVKAWADYENDYRWLIEQGYERPRLVFQPFWDGIAIGEVVQWDMQPSVEEDENGERFFPVDLSVPASKLDPGEGTFKCEVWFEYIDNRELSPETSIRIDQTAPNIGRPCPLRKDNVTLIDQAYLDQNGNKAPFKLDRWPDIRLEDTVQLFMLDSSTSDTTNLPFDPLFEVSVNADNKQQTPFLVEVPAARLTNGKFRVVCRLLDRSGNVGASSPSLDVEVLLQSGPVVLPRAHVPLATDGLVDLKDARTPVRVEIPRIEMAQPGDVLQVYWNTRPLQAVTVGVVQQWPVRVEVPWADITAPGFVGPVPASVYYTSSRHGGSQDETGIQVNVDLRVAGPDPQEPVEINPQLQPVVVKGLTANNVIAREDIEAELPVTVRVRLYDNPRAGDLLHLYWGRDPDTDANAQVVARYSVTGLEAPGQEVTFSLVPLSVILDVGDGPAIPVFYRTFNGVNFQRAKATRVSVDTAARPPIGQLVSLKVKSPPLSLFGWINCASKPWLGIPLIVPGAQADVQAGDRVEVRWQMFRTQRDGEEPTQPGLPAPPPAQPLMPAPVYLPAVEITTEGAASGQVLLMNEFTRLIFDVFRDAAGAFSGYARIGYRLTKVDGRSGEAQLTWLAIDIQRPGSLVCTASGDVSTNK